MSNTTMNETIITTKKDLFNELKQWNQIVYCTVLRNKNQTIVCHSQSNYNKASDNYNMGKITLMLEIDDIIYSTVNIDLKIKQVEKKMISEDDVKYVIEFTDCENLIELNCRNV